MDTINFLEYLASNTHHRRSNPCINQEFTRSIQQALQAKDAASLKQLLGEKKFFADMTRVFD
jgi:hypothetical protein